LTGAHAASTEVSPVEPDSSPSTRAHSPDPAIVRQILFATFVGAVLRVFALGRQSLWIDEVFTWYTADVGQPLRLSHLLENVHGPLYSLLLHLWVGLAGDGEWALRLPSAVFGIATVPALAWAGWRWLGRETAVPAAWLAAGSPFLVWYSQEARNYSLLILCACLSAGALLALRERPGAGRLAGALGISAAGLLSNLSYALLLPLHLKWFIGGSARPGRRALAVGAAVAVLLLATLPWLPHIGSTWDWRRLAPGRVAGSTETALRGATTFHAAAVPFALHAFTVGYTLGPSLRELRSPDAVATLARHVPELALVLIVFGALGVLGLRELARRHRLLDAFLWAGLPALAISYFALQNFKVFHPRYLAVGAPVVLLALAAGLSALGPRARLLFGLAVGGLWAVSLEQHYFRAEYAKEDCRSAIALVRSHASAGEQLLAVGADEPVFYYYRGPLPVGRFWLGYAADPARLAVKLDAALANARASWIVVSRPEDLDPAGNFARLLDARTAPSERWRFIGVRVWRLAPAAKPGSRVGAAPGPAARPLAAAVLPSRPA
jgi:hypothetical protein